MKNTVALVLTLIVCYAVAFGLNLLIYGGIVWVLVWALNTLGVYTIGSLAVVFSWKLVIIVALIVSLFSARTPAKKK